MYAGQIRYRFLIDPDWEVRYQALHGLFLYRSRGARKIFEAVAPLVADKK
jgi:hypothetical protein